MLKAQCPITVDAGPDIYVCPPAGPVQLDGNIFGDYLNFNWTPTTGMSGGNTLSPTVTVNQTTQYVLTGFAADFSNNLIVNGDFENGNSDFTSAYGYNPGNLVPEGVYDVLDNPRNAHPGFAACADHTTGTGNMMAVNGAGTPNQDVWCQTVSVMPNAQYVFSAWVTSLVAASPALLQFSINGTPLGPIFSAPGSICNWQNFFQTWNSGNNSSATICIVNQNTVLGGNDFALDDLFFNQTCSVTDTVTVNVVSVSAVAAPSLVTIPCDGANIQISGNGSSTGPNINYQWNTGNGNIVSGDDTLTPTIDAPGEYILEVSYVVNGDVICARTTQVTVILNPNPLSAWITPPQPLGCGSPTTLLVGNTTQAAFSVYEWSTFNGNIVGAADQKNCTVNQVGIYTLLITNSNTGCTATAEVSVTQTTNVPTSNATSNGIITCAQDSVPLFGTGSSNGANIAYHWTTISGQITGHPDSLQTTAGAGGQYILAVTNTANNCTAYDTITVPANITPPSVVGTLPPLISCDPNQDTISIFIQVGPPAFVLIDWTTSNGHIVSGQYTPGPQADQPGIYMVSVFDPANGCYNYDTSMVLANFTIPIAQILPADTLTCADPNILLQGSGSSVGANFSINWTSSNGGNILSGANTLTPTVNAPGDYWLILRDSISQCTDTAMVRVLADTSVVMAAANAPDTLTCAVDTVGINANGSSNLGNMTYQWTTPNGHFALGENTANPLVDAPGTYILELTNLTNGCVATDTVTVLHNTAPPKIFIQIPDTLTCAILTQPILAQIITPGLHTFLWTVSNGGNILSGDGTLLLTVNQAGTYTLTAASAVNSCTASASVQVVLEAGAPQVLTPLVGPLTCAQTTQILSANGSSFGPNMVYSWTTANGNITAGADSPTPTVSAPGTYTLLITNQLNGCTASSSVLLQQDTTAPFAQMITPADTLNCLTDQLELLGDGTGTSAWNTPDGNILFSNGFTAQIDAPGTYFLSTTDPNNGCIALDSVFILENIQLPTAQILPAATLTCALTNLSISANVGGQNIQLDWQTSDGNIVSGQNTNSPTIDQAGTYILIVNDLQNGCTQSASITVAQDTAAPILIIAPAATITCGVPTITIAAQNLSLPGNFTYTWTAQGGANITAGSTTLSPTLDAGGILSLSILNTDNGCETAETVPVVQNTLPPAADAGIDAILSCLTSTLTLQGVGSGAPMLTYQWIASNGGNIVSGQNTPNPVIDQDGAYTLTVENPVNGCTASDNILISNDLNAPSANAGTPSTLTCAVTSTQLLGTASSGPTVSYLWIASNGGNLVSGQNILSPTVDQAGIYTLSVTNSANGCVATSSVTVPQNIVPPTVEAGANVFLTCAVSSLQLSGNADMAAYAWTTANGQIISGGNTLNPNINAAGTYTLTATLASNGCSASDVVQVSWDTISPIFALNTPLPLTCVLESTALQGMVQQPTSGNYTAQWSTQNGSFDAPLNALNTSANAPGTYLLTIQNSQNGCTQTQTIIVAQDTLTPIVVSAAGGELTCTTQSLLLDGIGSSAGNSFSYQWSSPNGGLILSGGQTLMPTVSAVGEYVLMVSNAVNGCTASTSSTVGTNTTPPLAVIGQPNALSCLVNQVTLQASGSSQGANFFANWATSGGNIVSGQGTYAIAVSSAGNYLLTIENSQNGCTATAQMLVQSNIQTPGALILPIMALDCNTPMMILVGSSPTMGSLLYVWTTAGAGNILSGASTPTPLIDAPGTYNLLITNPNTGCSSSTSIVVTKTPDPSVSPLTLQPNCFVPTGAIAVSGVTGGQAPYQYSINGGQSYQAETQFPALAPSTYSLVVQDANGCTQVQTVVIDAPFLPTLQVDDIQKIDQGDSILLAPSTNIAAADIATWEWTPANGLSCTDCASPWARPAMSHYYVVKVEDLNGCIAEERILVQVSRKRYVYPPNIFSPNDDGDNDFFTLYAKGVQEIRQLTVFDRWGEAVFEQRNFAPNDESMGWNGRFKGDPVNPAVYVWVAEIVFTDGEVEILYGDITVLR